MFDASAKWIWIRPGAEMNEYAVFEGDFDFAGKTGTFTVAAETDYILHINGRLVSFGQFAGYPFEKYYDEYLNVVFSCLSNNTTLNHHLNINE